MIENRLMMPGKHSRIGLKTAAAGVALATVITFFFLASEVVRKLVLLETAASDNVQFTLSQVEVELAKMRLATTFAQSGAADDMTGLRREFDIFYSRVKTITDGAIYAPLRNIPKYATAVSDLDAFLSAAVPIIDAANPVLQERLGDLDAMIVSTAPATRTLAMSGLMHFNAAAKQQRESVSSTLFDLAIVTGLLLVSLLLSLIFLWRQFRLSETRADALHHASTRLGTVIETSLDAIIVADRDNHILEFNSAAEKMFRQPQGSVIGCEMADRFIPERFCGSGAAAPMGPETRADRKQFEATRCDGSTFPAELSVQSADGPHGKIFVSFLRDISTRLAAEQDLIVARDQAVAGEKAKSEFIAVMSHEIRTPLNGLLGTLSLIRDTRLTAKQKDYVETLENSGALLLHHINNVLDITKYEAGKLTVERQPVDLGALLQGVVDNQRDLAAASGNIINWEWQSPLPGMVSTDPGRLSQVLINIVGNAVKFTENGQIRLKAEARFSAPDQADLTLWVIDSGIGIAPQQLERVFQDFETGDTSYGRKSSGTGLGLGIARRIVTALGGTMGVDSTPGKGSTFWIKLPVDVLPDQMPSAAGMSPSETVNLTRALKVLIIEDNEVNRNILREMLRADGHHVTDAANGREGVIAAHNTAFDLILTDISMPLMDGLEATTEIRSGGGTNADTPIIAVTAHAMPDEIARFRAAGMVDTLSKPIDRQALRDLLRGIGGATAGPSPEAQSAQTGAQTFHRSQLQRLADELGHEALMSLLAMFRQEGDDTMAYVRSDDPDWSAAKAASLAHKLAGSAAVFGFARLRKVLVALEAAVKEGADKDTIRKATDGLAAEWRQVLTEIVTQEGTGNSAAA